MQVNKQQLELGMEQHAGSKLEKEYLKFAGSEDKVSACSAGDLGSVPALGRSAGEGNGNPLQYSCLGNSMDRGAWWATVHGISKELDTT